ncbi:MAG: hypothetical protein IKT36_04640, partial [Methanocorpusculum sp.]|nr:hypothetical protein [Methanocorpusculum sp.]
MNTKHIISIFTSIIIISLLIPGTLAASPAIEEAVDRGLDFIADHQNTDGGFFEPNTDKTSISSTWFTTQALVAAGEDPLTWTKIGKTPLNYLVESPDGK